jgi:hypothetical protein
VNWEAIGAVGEICGAVAVVVTLFYLGIQIRQSSASLNRANEYAQARSVHDINSLYVQVFAPLTRDPELARIYKRGMAGRELNDTEAVQFSAFANTYLAWLEDMYVQQGLKLGFATESTDSLFDTSSPYVRMLLASSASRDWWRSEARFLYSSEFVAWINKALELDIQRDA